MAHERQVRRSGAQGDLAGLVPLCVGWRDRAQRAVDLIGVQRTAPSIPAEQHARSELHQPGLVLVVLKHHEVPLPRGLSLRARGVAGKGTAHRQRAEVWAAEVLSWPLGRLEESATQTVEGVL